MSATVAPQELQTPAQRAEVAVSEGRLGDARLAYTEAILQLREDQADLAADGVEFVPKLECQVRYLQGERAIALARDHSPGPNHPNHLREAQSELAWARAGLVHVLRSRMDNSYGLTLRQGRLVHSWLGRIERWQALIGVSAWAANGADRNADMQATNEALKAAYDDLKHGSNAIEFANFIADHRTISTAIGEAATQGTMHVTNLGFRIWARRHDPRNRKAGLQILKSRASETASRRIAKAALMQAL